MPLSMGTRLGPYEILAPVGAGGMGEVYKARDTRLDRIVALKVSAAQFSERFEREAHAIGALNHPNICTLYDVGPNYLVMEYVEGAPLKGPLSVDQALKYGVQICAALDHAHKKGFTHRDLKPANILVTKAGIKLLDFGLAKLSSGSQAAKPPDDATLTMALTGKNEIIGTLYYMSPEQLQAQANGQEIDGRSDIFSFGLVLYEMLTGKRAFEGSSPASVIAAIMDRPAPSIADVAPPALDRVLKKCLAKDPEDRWHSARDLKDEIEWIANTPAIDAKSKPARSQSRLGWVAASLAVVSIVLGGLYWRATRPVDRALMRLSVDLGPDAVAGQFTTAVISPDGSRLVFPVKSPDGKQLLASRLLSETKPTLLSGTENGRDPFFSPDGTWIGFFADGKMKKIPVQGGASVVLCETPNPRGAAWRDDGTIVAAFNVNGALSRISSGGGTPQPVTKLQGALTHRWPQTLPGSEAVLFTLSRSIVDFEDASIAAVSLKTGEIKVLVRGGYFGRYLPTSGSTGHLVYVHDGVLFAVPFDPARLELRGTAVPMLEDLAGDPNSGAGQFTSTGQGTLVYRAGKVSVESWPVWWLDSSGKTTPLITTLGYYVMPRFSPDGQRLALLRSAGSSNGIIVYDLQRDTVSRLAFDSQQPVFPEWSPDGKHIVFRFSSPNGFSLGWIRADGAGETQHLLD
ncbi:MAG: protein kinase, partial [Bryobacteraceae bacterium]